MFCKIYLIRHGETDWNVQKKIQGHTDIPLNENGELQALMLKEKLKDMNFSAVFSSDLMRARRTAEIVLGTQQTAIVQSHALRELDLGAWEGCSKSDLKQHPISNRIDMSKDDVLSYLRGNESYAEAYARVKAFLAWQAQAHLGSSILVSSHGGIMRSVLYHLDFRPGMTWNISNCAVITLHINQAGEISLVGHDGIELSDK